MTELLPIGRFAVACRLSIKALRHYDELGLLTPARVDASGYRYYARAQARTAIAISLLRSLDVPLPVIKAVLSSTNPADLASRLATERTRIERELARSKQALFCVERIIQDGALMPYQVTVREEPAFVALAVEATTVPEQHVEAGYELFVKLRAALVAFGAPVVEPVMCLLPDAPRTDGEDTMILRMCVQLPEALADAAKAARAGASIERIAAGPFAYVTHRGPYEELGIAQHAIVAWLEERGHEAAGPMREVYIDDPTQVEAPELRTEVGIPLVTRIRGAGRRA